MSCTIPRFDKKRTYVWAPTMGKQYRTDSKKSRDGVADNDGIVARNFTEKEKDRLISEQIEKLTAKCWQRYQRRATTGEINILLANRHRCRIAKNTKAEYLLDFIWNEVMNDRRTMVNRDSIPGCNKEEIKIQIRHAVGEVRQTGGDGKRRASANI